MEKLDHQPTNEGPEEDVPKGKSLGRVIAEIELKNAIEKLRQAEGKDGRAE